MTPEQIGAMTDPRIVGLKEALTIIAATRDYWPEDLFGIDLTGDEWELVRSAGIPTERIASACYRHALSVVMRAIREALADYEEPLR